MGSVFTLYDYSFNSSQYILVFPIHFSSSVPLPQEKYITR